MVNPLQRDANMLDIGCFTYWIQVLSSMLLNSQGGATRIVCDGFEQVLLKG